MIKHPPSPQKICKMNTLGVDSQKSQFICSQYFKTVFMNITFEYGHGLWNRNFLLILFVVKRETNVISEQKTY